MTKRARARDEGTVYQRGSDGRWVASLRWPDGQRKSRYRKTRMEASRALSELRTMREADMPPPDDRLTVNDWLDRWLKERVSRHTAGTQASYRRAVDHIRPALGREVLRKLGVRQVATWLDDMLEEGVAPASAGLFLQVLRTSLNDAMREDLILHRNPASLVKAPKYRAKKGKPLSVAEATGLMQSVRTHRLHALIVLALTSALRAGELLGLTWGAVHLDDSWMEVLQQVKREKGKGLVLTPTKTERSAAPVVLTGLAVRALQQHRGQLIEQRMRAGDAWRGQDNPVAPEALVFPSSVGTPMDPAIAWRIWSGMLERAGIEHRRLHDSRHTTATLLRALGVAPEVVQQVLRHAHVTMQATYVHTDLSQQQAAAAALDELLGEVLG